MKYIITSSFLEKEAFRQKPHNGIDFAMPKNTPLISTEGGVVEKISNINSSLGKGVFIKWHDGKVAVYGHLNEITVKVGDKIKTGDLIGYSGNTGHVVGKNGGYHLHFGLKQGDKFIDPEPYADLIQNMDKLKAAVENTPLPEFKFSIPEFLSSANPDDFNGFLNMLKANFINYTQLFDYTIFLQHFHNFIQFFF